MRKDFSYDLRWHTHCVIIYSETERRFYMGFVKGMITGVLVVAGAVVGAAVVSVIKDEKKEKEENKKYDARESKASGNNGDVIFSGIRGPESNINQKPSGKSLSS